MENQTPVAPVSTPQVAIKQPKQSNFLVILLSVLLTISVIISGFFAFQTQKLVKELTLLRTEEKVVELPTIEPIVVLESKIYDNNKFSFSYPNYLPNFKLREQAYGEKFPLPAYESVYLDPNQKGGGPGYSVALSVRGPETNTENKDLGKWLIDQGLTSEGYGGNFVRKHITKMIDGKEAIYQTGIASGFSIPTEHNLYFQLGNEIYTIHLDIQTNEETASKYIVIFDQIFSTLKFTN